VVFAALTRLSPIAVTTDGSVPGTAKCYFFFAVFFGAAFFLAAFFGAAFLAVFFAAFFLATARPPLKRVQLEFRLEGLQVAF
jgi:hypothetical protein